ncbi:MAG: SurA N-terminal domain-containing protein [Gammaproteobacteria bacterium]|nr:SurA N-terminal domain-containing protein [Gammaproteobacteria bacterium]
MLQFIRERAQGWIAGVIVALISIPFALWGIQEYVQSSGDVVVAEVNGQELGLREFQDAYQRYRRQLQALAGERLDISKLNESVLKSQALEQLVNETLLRQAAAGAGMRIGDEQVRAAVRSFQGFHRQGVFAQDLYERQLQINGMTPVGFEEMMRRDMLVEQIRQGIAETTFVTEEQARDAERLSQQTRDLRYAVIESGPFEAQVNPGDEEIGRYYEEHADRYTTPETVKIAYIDLSLEALSAQVAVDDAALRQYYGANEAAYSIPEERSANHILVRVERKAAQDLIEAARKRALEYRDAAIAGTSFEEILEQAAATGAANETEGGETGMVRRGVLPKEFDETLFSMQTVGDISEPIQTDFGFHIIRLDKIVAGSERSFEEARADVERDYRHEQAERLFYEQAERLSNITFEQPDTLAGAAEELGLPVQETGYFSRTGGEDLAGQKAVVDAAFSPEVMIEGNNSAPIELGDDRLVVLRAVDHQAQARRPLEEVRERIRTELVAEKARQMASDFGHELLVKLRAGGGPIADAASLQWQQARGVDRHAVEVNRAVLRHAFKLPRPQPGKPVYDGVPLGTGDYAIIELQEVHDIAAESLGTDVLLERRKDMLASEGAREWLVLLAALRQAADVETHPDGL